MARGKMTTIWAPILKQIHDRPPTSADRSVIHLRNFEVPARHNVSDRDTNMPSYPDRVARAVVAIIGSIG